MANDYGFYLENPDEEDDIFYTILGSAFDEQNLCRYTSLNGLFRTLSNKKEGQSMCCLVGMNDKSETSYVESYLGIAQKGSMYNPQKENKFFILSLLPENKRDDLTMWRLYGNDTNGVCIEYFTDIDKLTTGNDDKFRLFKINYGIDKNHHPSLDFLKELINTEIEGRYFTFRRLNEWKHFFKSYEYKDEEEIRLLYKSSGKEGNIKWILTSDYNIVTPIITFGLNDFPLLIKGIILGPNCPNKDTNKIQLQQMIIDTKIPYVKPKKRELIKDSECITYR